MSRRLTAYRRSIDLPVSQAEAFAWHARPGALERLMPPWEKARVVSATGGIEPGAQVLLALKQGPLTLRWRAEHTALQPPDFFQDVQKSGPFAAWIHTHRFEAVGATSRLHDEVEYAVPGGRLGAWLGGGLVRRKLDAMFRYRQATTAADLAMHAAHAAAPRLRVLVTGASGLVGRAIVGALTTGGHTVIAADRGEAGPVRWSVDAGLRDDPGPIDAVVHLAGASLAQRWTPARKAEMRRSRVDGTRALVASLRAFGRRPGVFLSASAVGWYDDLGDTPQDEDAPRGPAGFRTDLVADWEAEAARADAERVVHLRLGVVVSPRGGMLQQVLPVFRLGLGGPVGSGRQHVPWIGLDDVVELAVRILQEPGWRGPVNAVAPEAVTSRDFARALGRVLRRPAVLPAPAFALRLAFGEMADALLLAGAHVVPARALAMGHGFRHPRLEDALRHGLGR